MIKNPTQFFQRLLQSVPRRSFSMISSDSTILPLDLHELVVQKVIGIGGFSQVCKAHMKDSPTTVFALKKFDKIPPSSSSTSVSPQLSSSSNPDEQFQTEKSILSEVKSPFIVELHGVAEDESSHYLALEYQGGGDLFDLIMEMRRKGCVSQAGGLDENLARFHIAETLLGLEHLHKHNIVWCDLKPENIIFDGTDGHLKLTDFGTALKIEPSSDLPKGKHYTLEYMAPELVVGKNFDSTADIWSLGVLLYELLAGSSPFRGENRGEIEENIKRVSYDPSRIFNRKARDLIKRLLVTNPKERLTIQQIKVHPFFENILWRDIEEKKVQPPIPSWAEDFYFRRNDV